LTREVGKKSIECGVGEAGVWTLQMDPKTPRQGCLNIVGSEGQKSGLNEDAI
jgi:hypothetical protein